MRIRDTAIVTVSETIRPKQRRRRSQEDTDLTVTIVDREVLAIALELAEGDRARLVIESETSVLVINCRRR